MTGTNLLAPVPFCYAIEYKQKHGVTATNITNNIIALGNVTDTTIKQIIGEDFTNNAKTGLQTVFSKVKDTINSALSSVINSDTNIGTAIDEGIKKIKSGIGGI
jgi:hypothetical protein